MCDTVMNMRYVWNHRYGRLAILMAVIGVIGLMAHIWIAAPLLLTIPREL